MKILMVHNFYRSGTPSGEDSVVRQDVALLRDAGHEVELVAANSDDIEARSRLGRLLVPSEVVWSRGGARQVAEAVERFHPDVAHVHNTFPLLSPAVVTTLDRMGVPVVATLHNFRLVCPQGLLTRDGRVCHDCVGRAPLPSVIHKCYRDSVVATLPLAVSDEVHRRLGTWTRRVSRFITMAAHSRDIFLEAGFPADRLVVRPHGIDDPGFRRDGAGEYALFVGRLTPDKGGLWLAERWPADAPPLLMAGDGPERAEIERIVEQQPPGRVTLLGARSREEVRQFMAGARMLVISSRSPETFGLTAAEAMSVGVPAVGPSIGATPEVIGTPVPGQVGAGIVYDWADEDDFRRAVLSVSDPATSIEMGGVARSRYEALYSPASTTATLVACYRAAIADSQPEWRQATTSSG